MQEQEIEKQLDDEIISEEELNELKPELILKPKTPLIEGIDELSETDKEEKIINEEVKNYSITKDRDARSLKEEQYQARFDALLDANAAGQQLNISNASLYFEQHIHFQNTELAERKMKELEYSDSVNRYEQECRSFLEHRQREYSMIAVLFREALAELLCEDKKEKMKQYSELRKEIKEKYPKPIKPKKLES